MVVVIIRCWGCGGWGCERMQKLVDKGFFHLLQVVDIAKGSEWR